MPARSQRPNALSPLAPASAAAVSVVCPVVAAPGGRVAVLVGGTPVEAHRLGSVGALAPGQRALVVFDGGDAARPVVVGVIQDRLEELVDLTAPDARPSAVDPPARPASDLLSVWADGREVRIEAAERLELRCGEASITLRADGKVEIHGTHVLSRSSGPNRIKGGSVSIN